MPNKHGSFILSLSATVALAWATVLAINSVVDPYGFNSLAISAKLNGSQASAHHQQRVSKAFRIAQVQPRTLVLGNSRQGHAIDPRHPALARLPGAAYNASFDGAHIEEIYAYFRHAIGVAGTSHFLIGLDLSSFGKFEPQAAYRPGMLADFASKNITFRYFEYARIYGSAAALVDSYESFRARAKSSRWDHATGRRTDTIFLERLAGCGGTRDNFLVREARDVRLNTTESITEESIGRSLQIFAQLLEDAYARNIQLELFISPIHSRSLFLLGKIGKGDLYNRWRAGLVQVNEEAARRHKSRPFVVWDFSGYNSVTTEKVPDRGSVELMTGYWEGSHYKATIGNIILDRMLADPRESAHVPGDFGKPLTVDNIASHLDEESIARSLFIASNSQQVKDLQEIVEKKGAHKPRVGCTVL